MNYTKKGINKYESSYMNQAISNFNQLEYFLTWLELDIKQIKLEVSKI